MEIEDFNKNENPFLRVELKVEELSEVILSAKRREVFLLKRMDDFEKTDPTPLPQSQDKHRLKWAFYIAHQHQCFYLHLPAA